MVYQSYTVRQGDSLSKIAQALGISDWRTIFNANTHQISHPDLIYPGQVLRIPMGGTTTTVTTDPGASVGGGSSVLPNEHGSGEIGAGSGGSGPLVPAPPTTPVNWGTDNKWLMPALLIGGGGLALWLMTKKKKRGRRR